MSNGILVICRIDPSFTAVTNGYQTNLAAVMAQALRPATAFNKKEHQMSPKAGFVLMEEIAPRLRSAIPQCVKTVGCEDHEELYQDGLAMAAHMLHNLEERGKTVTPGNVAYYTLLHLKSGRRSYSTGRTDAMGSGTQIGHNSMVLSLEEEVGFDEELGEPVRLEEMLTCSKDDPSMEAGRNLDWESFLDDHDPRYLCIVHDLGSGRTMLDTARACRIPYHEVRELREDLVEELEEWMGPDAIADSLRIPNWMGNIAVNREKTACRADRRRN